MPPLSARINSVVVSEKLTKVSCVPGTVGRKNRVRYVINGLRDARRNAPVAVSRDVGLVQRSWIPDVNRQVEPVSVSNKKRGRRRPRINQAVRFDDVRFRVHFKIVSSRFRKSRCSTASLFASK